MRIAVIILACLSTSWCFDLASIDTDFAYWLPTTSGEADITIKIEVSVSGIFNRQDSFPYRYGGAGFNTLPNGKRVRSVFSVGKRVIPSFETNGNRGWIYVRTISEEGAFVRCVIREAPDTGKILYEREFLIPWSSKVFLLRTEKEHIDAEIHVSTDQTKKT